MLMSQSKLTTIINYLFDVDNNLVNIRWRIFFSSHVIVSNNVLEYCIIIILHYLGLTFLSFNSMCKHVFIHLFIIYLSIITIGF